MATGLNIDTDFSSNAIETGSYSISQGGSERHYAYFHAPACVIRTTNTSYYVWPTTSGCSYGLQGWTGSSWQTILRWSIGNFERDMRCGINHPISGRSTDSQSWKNITTNYTIFKIYWDRNKAQMYLNVDMFGIGGMRQSQRDKIRGLSPVGVNTKKPFAHSSASYNASAYSFNNEDIMKGKCMNDFANNELQIQPKNRY